MVCIIKDTSPWGLIFRGSYYRRYFCVSDLGDFYTEGLIFGILRYCNYYTWRFLLKNVSSTLTWSRWSWLTWHYVSLHFLIPFFLSQPAVTRKDGMLSFRGSYLYLFHKYALPISFAVMANPQSVNLKVKYLQKMN